jgi:hypothetical protein
VVNGAEQVLKQVSSANPTRGASFRLAARAEGNLLTLEVDGVPRLSLSDGTFADGGVGLLLRSSRRLALTVDDFAATVE